ncbi:MAG: hypothetical protein DDT31_00311 [Syntrophomonadaceae bacterium]|nr:hypothetical protein [Bacillota bacterium]
MSFILPAGTYVIGDPCYNLTDSQYDEFLKTSNSLQTSGVVTLSDGLTAPVYALHTATGEGRFISGGFEYAVDSGTIGIMSLQTLEGREPEEATKVVKFKHSFEVYDSAGTLVFGHIEINTHYISEDEDGNKDDGFDYEDFDGF